MYYDHNFENGVDDGREGKCVVNEWNKFKQELVPCGRSWTSVVHPPDQFRHWCSALENGWDCMHFEEGYN